MKASIIVPVYNERETVGKVLDRLAALPIEKEIIVVEDPSTDGTREYLERLAKKGEFKAVFRPEKRGKGAAIRTGLAEATGQVVVIQDADLEYTPEEIPQLLVPFEKGEARAVYGSRFRGRIEGMSGASRVANRVLTFVANLLFGVGITDEATCYKAVETELLRSLDLRCERFEFCPEVTAKLGRRGIKIVELPISYRARTGEEGKKISWRDGFEALYTLLRYRIKE
jgi:glycosyltransferase involved in cell wall biosynthesis